MSKSADVTTRELEGVVNRVNALCAERCRLDRRRRGTWRAWRNDMVGRAHGVMKPAARPYAGKALAGSVHSLLADLDAAWRWADELDDVSDELERELDALQRQWAELYDQQAQNASQVEALTQELAQARAELGRRAVPKTVVLPAQAIEIGSPLQREALRLMADEGLGRVWRLAARLVAGGACAAENSARNALQRLTEKGLVDDYQQHGRRAAWAPKSGGRRRLVTLSEFGRLWCRGAFGREPVESEIAAAARRHRSVSHGVAVLEARDYLRGHGIAVDDDPAVLLATAERWGARAEPDLAMTLADGVWPIEVQREVAGRRTDKWAKTLALAGRLALILFSADAAKKQVAILQRDLRSLPSGVIRVTSLEALEADAWDWLEIVVPERDEDWF